MKILALEFSSSCRSAAVVETTVLGSVRDESRQFPTGLTLADAALRAAGIEPEAIDGLVVGLGPGSYTGIRSAIAVAQGWQLARGTRLLGISTAECLAAQARGLGLFGRVNVVIDAQRGEFYLATYELGPKAIREAAPLQLASPEEVRRRLAAGELVLGPEVCRWFPAGRLLAPDAAMLGRLAQERTNFVSGEALEPIYLRPVSFVKAPPPRVMT
jgi:tRNA threonylcarbamoyladenosine biosynthesis protein TsaB